MGRKMYEFRCNDGHVSESLVDYETTEITCTVCEQKAFRIISAPRIQLDGTDPIYVSAYDKWAKRHEEKAKIERKQNEA